MRSVGSLRVRQIGAQKRPKIAPCVRKRSRRGQNAGHRQETGNGGLRYAGPNGFPAFDGNDNPTYGTYVDGALTITDFAGEIMEFERAEDDVTG